MILSILKSKIITPKDSKHKIAKQITLIGLLGFFMLALFNVNNSSTLLTFSVCVTMCLIAYVFLSVNENYKIIYWFLSIVSTFVIQYSTNVFHEDHITHYPDFLWIIPCILIAFYGLGTKAGILFFSINVLGIAYFIFFEMNSHILNAVPQSINLKIALFIEYLMSLIVIGSFISYYIKANNKNIEKLRTLNSELETKNELINKQNEEKTILIQEIHHRVKNNLQIIVSLLRLQINEEESNDYSDQLIKLTNRIHSMSLVHQKLYQKEDLSNLLLDDYIIDLYEHIKKIFDLDKNIILNLESDISTISYESMIPIGLIINELITNSFKYADKERNVIKIRITKEKNNLVQLKYDDSSSYQFFNTQNTGFGIELIIALVEQLDGKITENKSEKIISFKAM